ncbi:hypothetical protein [Parasphaerochaeta coccoides]|uniref:hypothetical protein n=1 Tax=Parasphaerochaeta coccoides TaxID=273376 RepID=UPI0002FD3EF1|nr:hypothetical protein [Parasphaerochaeta coccoides]
MYYRKQTTVVKWAFNASFERICLSLSLNHSLAGLDTSYHYLTENIKLAKQGNKESLDYLNSGYWWAAGASAVGAGLSGYSTGANLDIAMGNTDAAKAAAAKKAKAEAAKKAAAAAANA